MSWGRVRVTGGFVLLWTAIIWLDSDILLWAWTAVAAHELGHWLVLKAFHGRVARWEFTLLGITMELEHSQLPYSAEILVTLGGPAANLLLAFVCSICAPAFSWQEGYVLSGASLLLGAFNLIPAQALDGGRVLWHLLCWRFEPRLADRACWTATLITASGITVTGLYIFAVSGYNITLLAIGLYLLFTATGGSHVPKIGNAAAAGAKTRALCGRGVAQRL